MAKKFETWWCIASGKLLLPFTARTTRHQAIADYNDRNGSGGDVLSPYNTAVKVVVRRAKPRPKIAMLPHKSEPTNG